MKDSFPFLCKDRFVLWNICSWGDIQYTRSHLKPWFKRPETRKSSQVLKFIWCHDLPYNWSHIYLVVLFDAQLSEVYSVYDSTTQTTRNSLYISWRKHCFALQLPFLQRPENMTAGNLETILVDIAYDGNPKMKTWSWNLRGFPSYLPLEKEYSPHPKIFSHDFLSDTFL